MFGLSLFVQLVSESGRLVRDLNHCEFTSLDSLFSYFFRIVECLSEFLDPGDQVFARIYFNSDFVVSLDLSKIIYEYENIRCNISKKGDVDFNGNVFFTIKPSEK